ncbi:MAG: hypothetical protein VYE47_04330 [Pseudomonadota bacterium]|nr:hypothetical protein [Pseudomonadota bacterium]
MAKDKNNDAPQASTADKSELGQLREILFGQSSRDFQQQLASLDEKLESNFSALNQKLENHVASLNKTIETQFAALSEQLSADNTQHQQAQENLKGLHDTLKSELEMAEAAAQDDTSKLESKLSKEMDAMETLFNKRHEALLERLQQVTEELSSSKTDRKTLASLLSTMASNLATDQP